MAKSNRFAVQIRELHIATFTPQPRPVLRDITERLSPRSHEVCLHGKGELLPTEHFID